MTNTEISERILQSQKCQRNWDLSKEIPEEDLNLIITAATQCPSKQNIAYYNVHAITNRNIIEAIHANTEGFTMTYNPYQITTNTQVLANLLIVLEPADITINNKKDSLRNEHTIALVDGSMDDTVNTILTRDTTIAIGIASGYINLTAAMLGYYTGFCSCFSPFGIKNILNLKNEPILLMGIGFKDETLHRRTQHTNHNYLYPTKQKQNINVSYWK